MIPNSKCVVQRSARRGSAAVALVVAVALLALVTTAAVMSGARDSRVGTDRMDGLHAMMAAEAGLQMALREFSHNSDEDADGGIGTLGSSTPKSIGSASVVVTSETDDDLTTLTSTGTIRNARRTVSVTVSSESGVGTAFWSRSGQNRINVSSESGSSWAAATSSATMSRSPVWVRSALNPLRDESAVITLDSDKTARIAVRTGTTWSAWTTGTSDTTTSDQRNVDIAYEQVSGEGLACYFTNTDKKLAYRTIINGVVSSQSLKTLPTSDDVRWVAMIPRPGSDQILVLTLTSNKGIVATIWNGSSFGTSSTLDTSAQTDATECVAGAWESQSGQAVAVWGRSGSNSPRYSTWNGTSWTVSSAMGSTGSAPRWVSMASDPTSDAVLMVAVVDDQRPYACNWTGSAWGTPIQLGVSHNDSEGICADVAFEGTGTRGMVFYRKNPSNQLHYRTWSGTAWGAESSAFHPSSDVDFVRICTVPNSSNLYLYTKSGTRLDVATWNGTSVGTMTTLATDLAGSGIQCSASLLASPSGGSGGMHIVGFSSNP